MMIFIAAVDYIELNFGGDARLEKTIIKEKLPLYLSNKYEFRKMNYYDKEFLLIDCNIGPEISILSLEKHLKRILEVSNNKAEVILIYDNLSKYKRIKLFYM